MRRQSQGLGYRGRGKAIEKLLREGLSDAATLRMPTRNTSLASLHADKRNGNVHYSFTSRLVSDASANAADRSALQRILLILVDPREFARGCLSSWLRSFREFEVLSFPDLNKSLQADILRQAGAVIINEAAPTLPEEWLDERIEWLLAHVPDLPIIVIADHNDTRIPRMLAGRPRLRGYIPTSCSMELAATIIRLVIAGGTYVPRVSDGIRSSAETLLQMPVTTPKPTPVYTSTVKLTPRELAVLDLLQRGMPNKVISHRLRMSQSTVKAHVHNIIAKLKVHNRTEAAIAARDAPPTTRGAGHDEADGRLSAGTAPRSSNGTCAEI